SGFPVIDFKILTTNFCGNLPLLIQNISYVQYANIDRLKIYWNWPSLTDTSAYLSPVQGDIFTHVYESFGYTPQKQFTVKAEAYSSGGCFTNQFNTTVLFASPRLMFDKIPQYCSNITTPVTLTQARDTSSFSGTGYYSGAGILSNTFTPSSAGAGTHDIIYHYTLSNGCSDSIVQAVKVGLQPSVNAGSDITILTGGSTIINATASGGNTLTYQWQPPTALSSTIVLTPEASPLYDTYYVLTATNEDACSNSDSVLIKVLQNPQIPNAFSPNGDGINEKWIIKYLDSYPDCIVEIFNRYGQLIFHSSGYNNPWDGTYNGKPLPVGTYYYIIDTKKITRKFSGSVTILR
ncbi:MAG TPA: gliding motility-associated C-terminal domain-containing protein, partial [Chitinophagaceae bacterium]|nr:gliding motility-associated C-terminal domain-containing protein [Chitinophagaceae bacterium]